MNMDLGLGNTKKLLLLLLGVTMALWLYKEMSTFLKMLTEYVGAK